MKRFVIVAALAGVSGCATNHQGWTGSGAQPFDSALAECQSSSAAIADAGQRQAALNQCMAAKGWTRPAS